MWYEHTPYETTNATPVNAFLVEIPDSFAGLYEVDLITLNSDGSAAVSYKAAVTFSKVGTLTLGAITTIHTDIGGITGLGVNIVNDSDNIAIELTGVAATTLVWIARTNLLTTNYTALP